MKNLIITVVLIFSSTIFATAQPFEATAPQKEAKKAALQNEIFEDFIQLFPKVSLPYSLPMNVFVEPLTSAAPPIDAKFAQFIPSMYNQRGQIKKRTYQAQALLFNRPDFALVVYAVQHSGASLPTEYVLASYQKSENGEVKLQGIVDFAKFYTNDRFEIGTISNGLMVSVTMNRQADASQEPEQVNIKTYQIGKGGVIDFIKNERLPNKFFKKINPNDPNLDDNQ